MRAFDKFNEELEAMKDLYIKMVKNATMGLENDYDSEDDIEDESVENEADNQQEPEKK